MERFTADTDGFAEDELPPWLLKQQEDAERAAELANRREKLLYQEGDQVGNFLFVRYLAYKNRAMFRCQECGRQFQYNVYGIKNKKRCKWYRYHGKSPKLRQ